MRGPKMRIVDVLGEVLNGEPAALVFDVGKQIRQPRAGVRNLALVEHGLPIGIDDRLRRARQYLPQACGGDLNGHGVTSQVG